MAGVTPKGQQIATLVELHEVSKHFGGARALESFSVEIEGGSVHAFVGENGAGKSTLGKIIGGVISPDRGELFLRGASVRFHSPREALRHGIATIAQELAIVPELTAAENVFLGAEPRLSGVVRRKELRQRYRNLCDAVGFGVRPDAVAGQLRVAEQQQLEILRAIARDAEILVLDEPSAALSRNDVEKLHQAIRSLRARGRTIVLVSHLLGEVLEIADDVTVMRDGRRIRSGRAKDETESSLIEAMLGRSLDRTFPVKEPPAPRSPVLLSVRGLSAPGVGDVSLEVRAGEIVVLAGLVGAGRSELAEAIVGLRRAHGGKVEVAGRVIARRTPLRMLRAGLAMIPESRKEKGLLLGRSVTENAVLSILPKIGRAGYVSRRVERRRASSALEAVDVRAAHSGVAANALSGGNQQKLLFARVVLADPVVLIADEPTRGVDVGARRAIYELLVEFARQGRAVLLISSDIEEVLGIANRILVMRNGRVVAEFDGSSATEQDVLGAAFLEGEAVRT